MLSELGKIPLSESDVKAAVALSNALQASGAVVRLDDSWLVRLPHSNEAMQTKDLLFFFTRIEGNEEVDQLNGREWSGEVQLTLGANRRVLSEGYSDWVASGGQSGSNFHFFVRKDAHLKEGVIFVEGNDFSQPSYPKLDDQIVARVKSES